MTKSAKVVFDKFDGGDYGRDWSAMDQDDKFRAINIIEYPGGWIGPRSPVIRFEVPDGETPNEEDPPIIGDLNDEPRAIWFVDNQIVLTSDGYAWNVQTGQRSVDAVDDVTLVADYFITTFGMMWCNTLDAGDQIDFIIRAFNIGDDGSTVPAIGEFTDPAPMSGSMRAERYNDTIVYSAYRTFDWSDGLIFDGSNDWPAGNTSDIYTRAIYDMIEQKNTLVFVTGSFTPNTELDNPSFVSGKFRPLADVYVLYGSLLGNATLRKIDSGPEPVHTINGAYIWTASGDDVYWSGYRSLVRFDGAEVVSMHSPLPRIYENEVFSIGPDYEAFWWNSAPVVRQGSQILSGTVLPVGVGYAVPTDQVAETEQLRKGVFMWSNEPGGEKWTAHDPGIEFYADEPTWGGFYRPGAGLAKRGNSNFYCYQWISGVMIFVTGGSTDAVNEQAPKFYAFDSTPEFPDNRLNDGDTEDCVIADFYTHDYWDPEGREIYVESLTIDYAYKLWDEESDATNNTITVEVESLQLYDNNRPRGGGEVTFSPLTDAPASGESSEPGAEIIRGRIDIPARSEGSGNGFRIHISDWKGLSIRRITANVKFTSDR